MPAPPVPWALCRSIRRESLSFLHTTSPTTCPYFCYITVSSCSTMLPSLACNILLIPQGPTSLSPSLTLQDMNSLSVVAVGFTRGQTLRWRLAACGEREGSRIEQWEKMGWDSLSGAPASPRGAEKRWPFQLSWPSYNSLLFYSVIHSSYWISIFYVRQLFDLLLLLIYFHMSSAQSSILPVTDTQ